MKNLILATLGTLVFAVIVVALWDSLRRSPAVQATGDEPAPYLTDLGEHAADAIAVTAPCALCDLG